MVAIEVRLSSILTVRIVMHRLLCFIVVNFVWLRAWSCSCELEFSRTKII